jgi:hypothetical protein
MMHEIWKDDEGLTTLCLAGKHGDGARANIIEPDAKLVSTFDAESHYEAMTKDYKYMDWGQYETDNPEYIKTYAEWGWV